jgi:hypothetical protein
MNKLKFIKEKRSSYVEDQLNKVSPSDKYGVQIKLTSNKGETKWIPINKEYKEDIIDFIKNL